jgi:hypothetical protein
MVRKEVGTDKDSKANRKTTNGIRNGFVVMIEWVDGRRMEERNDCCD